MKKKIMKLRNNFAFFLPDILAYCLDTNNKQRAFYHLDAFSEYEQQNLLQIYCTTLSTYV